jgi:hypothetical protein
MPPRGSIGLATKPWPVLLDHYNNRYYRGYDQTPERGEIFRPYQGHPLKGGAHRRRTLPFSRPTPARAAKSAADDDSYDLSKEACFYLNASQAPWNRHFHMYDYIVKEL